MIMVTTVYIREQGRTVAQWTGLTREDADWLVGSIAPVPGRVVGRVELLLGEEARS